MDQYEVTGETGTEDNLNPEQVAQNKIESQKKFTAKWLARINSAKREFSGWKTQAKRANKRYTGAKPEYSNEDAADKVWYPLLWSNVQVIRGAIYSSTPIPDVRRRNEQGMPVRSQVAVAVERGLEFFVDTQDFDGNLSRSLIDNLVSGLGQVKLEYDADVSLEPVMGLDGQPEMDSTGAPLVMPRIENQKVWLVHVPWKQFIWEPCTEWKDCNWVCYENFLDGTDVNEQFGVNPKLEGIGDTHKKDGRDKYRVYEIWCKRTKRVIFILDGRELPLKIMKDELGLKNFFPSPKPLIANCDPSKFEPITDYSYYEAQDLQIDRITRRIINLTSTATVARGFYDASIGEELAQLSSCDDTEYVPVPNLMAKLQAGGNTTGGDLWKRVIADFPIDTVVGVIRVLQEQRESELQHVYQITGISDIMRGASKASETATAQEIKANAGNSRVSIRLNQFNQFTREIFEIATDIMGGHWTPETWVGQTGIEVNDEMDEVLKNDLFREYMIDVETDSTIVSDSNEEKKQTSEAIGVLTQSLQTLLPMVSQGMLPADVIIQMIKLAMNPFKKTHAFEDAINQIPNTQQQFSQMQQGMQQAQQVIGQLNQQLQQAQAIIAEFNQREETREDLKVEAEAEKDFAQAGKFNRDAKEPYSTQGNPA